MLHNDKLYERQYGQLRRFFNQIDDCENCHLVRYEIGDESAKVFIRCSGEAELEMDVKINWSDDEHFNRYGE